MYVCMCVCVCVCVSERGITKRNERLWDHHWHVREIGRMDEVSSRYSTFSPWHVDMRFARPTNAAAVVPWSISYPSEHDKLKIKTRKATQRGKDGDPDPSPPLPRPICQTNATLGPRFHAECKGWSSGYYVKVNKNTSCRPPAESAVPWRGPNPMVEEDASQPHCTPNLWATCDLYKSQVSVRKCILLPRRDFDSC